MTYIKIMMIPRAGRIKP